MYTYMIIAKTIIGKLVIYNYLTSPANTLQIILWFTLYRLAIYIPRGL